MHDFRAELHILVAPWITFYAERVFAVGYMKVLDNHQTFADEVLLLCFGHIMNAMLIVIALHGKEDQFTSKIVYQIFRGGVLLFLVMDLCKELLVLDHYRSSYDFIS